MKSILRGGPARTNFPNLMKCGLCKTAEDLGIGKQESGSQGRGFCHRQKVSLNDAINFAAHGKDP